LGDGVVDDVVAPLAVDHDDVVVGVEGYTVVVFVGVVDVEVVAHLVNPGRMLGVACYFGHGKGLEAHLDPHVPLAVVVIAVDVAVALIGVVGVVQDDALGFVVVENLVLEGIDFGLYLLSVQTAGSDIEVVLGGEDFDIEKVLDLDIEMKEKERKEMDYC
jgi:hypothetical protein